MERLSVKKQSLSVTADAIRRKLDTTNSIVFEDDIGFEKSIQAIAKAPVFQKNAMALDTLKKWYTPFYYTTLVQAIADINNSSIVSTGSEDSSEVAVLQNNGYASIVLLKNIELQTAVTINANLTLILNGFTISYNGGGAAITCAANKIFIDGRIAESKIVSSTELETENATVVDILQGKCVIKGGSYESVSFGVAQDETSPNEAIKVGSNAVLDIHNSVVKAIDRNNGTNTAVYIESDGVLNGYDSHFEANSQNALRPCGVYNLGNTTLTQCVSIGKSNYTVNDAGTNYASASQGITHKGGKLILNDCYVLGTHSGVNSFSELIINGGLYEACGHGGLYQGYLGDTYIQNAIFEQAPMIEGYYIDNVVGENKAGFYTNTGTSETKIRIYCNNCKFYGEVQPIVIRNNVELYISNTEINLENENFAIRNDGSSYVFLGKGNNFTYTNLKYTRNYEIIDEEYVLEEVDS